MKYSIATILLFISMSLQAQDIKKYLEKPQPTFKNWVIKNKYVITPDLISRTGDAISTTQYMNARLKPHTKVWDSLPTDMAKSRLAMFAFSYSMVAGLSYMSYQMDKKNHHKIAKIPLIVDSIVVGRQVYRNKMLLKKFGK